MNYGVTSNNGKTLTMRYVCFGLLKRIPSWVSNTQWFDYYSEKGKQLGDLPQKVDIYKESEEGVETKLQYFEGFTPAELETLHYFPQLTRDSEKFIPEIVRLIETNAIFEGITFEGEPMFGHPCRFSLSMVDKRCDEVLIPMMFLRNFFEYSSVLHSFEFFLKKDFSFEKAFFLSMYFNIGTTVGNQTRFRANTDGDSSLFSSKHPAESIKAAIDGKPLEYRDHLWKDVLVGYSAYGEGATYETLFEGEDYNQWVIVSDKKPDVNPFSKKTTLQSMCTFSMPVANGTLTDIFAVVNEEPTNLKRNIKILEDLVDGKK